MCIGEYSAGCLLSGISHIPSEFRLVKVVDVSSELVDDSRQ